MVTFADAIFYQDIHVSVVISLWLSIAYFALLQQCYQRQPKLYYGFVFVWCRQ